MIFFPFSLNEGKQTPYMESVASALRLYLLKKNLNSHVRESIKPIIKLLNLSFFINLNF